MSPEPQRIWSGEEYLAFERASDEKHELFEGELFAMSGASRQHGRICWNVATALGPQLRQSGCEGFVSDMRVHVPATGLYTYPDVVVVCGEPAFLDEETPDTLLNPTLLLEVLSPSTEDYDRGRKFAHYRSLPSLEIFVLIAQDRVHVERFSRQPDGGWLLEESDDLGSDLELPGIGATLSLREVYDRVPGLPS